MEPSDDYVLRMLAKERQQLDDAMAALREIKDKYGIGDRHVTREKNAEIAGLRASLSMRYDADQRAIRRWQEAHPGNELTWPDHADMVVWLLEQRDEAREQWRMSSVCREMKEQRDKLAEASHNLCCAIVNPKKGDLTPFINAVGDALAAVKGENS
jgi:hypothetical protein